MDLAMPRLFAAGVVASLALSVVGVTGSWAQDQPRAENPTMLLDPITVTATTVPTPLSQLAASTEVITREEIEARQAPSVTELLRHVSGLHIDQAGARGSVSSLYLRGGDPNFTLVLIDGIKVNDPTNNRGGSFDFSSLSTDNIERIEIVRGPQSALYGSDAMSGVINIITRRGDTTPVRTVEASGGRYDRVSTRVQARGQVGLMDYALSGGYLDNGEPVEGSQFRSTDLQGNLGYPVSEAMELRWIWQFMRSQHEAFPDASGGPKRAVLRDVDQRDIEALTIGMTVAHELMPWWTYRFQFGLYHRSEDASSPGVAPGPGNPFGVPASQNDLLLQRYDLTLRHLFTVLSNLHLAVGAQAQFEKGRNTGSLAFLGPTDFTLSRDTYAPFVEVQWTPLPDVHLQSGLRVDIPEDFDPEVSPRIGASYKIAATQTTLRASWGEGFKVPSFFALGDPIVGNPNLKAETSQSVEVGVRQVVWDQRLSVDVAYFRNTFRDLIDFDSETFRLVNRNDVTTEGMELSLRLRPWPTLDVSTHMSYVATHIKNSDAKLRNRPTWRGGLTLHWQPLATFGFTVTTLFVGDSVDFSVPTGERDLEGYAKVDLAATWRVVPHWQLFFAVDNLFDEKYEESIGFPAPGVLPRGGVRATF